MRYEELIKIGFIHIEDNDQNWKDEYGYEYFRVEYWLNKKLFADWDVQKQTVKLYSLEKDGNLIIDT